jgi:primosomal protein N' (replication factor Y)
VSLNFLQDVSTAFKLPRIANTDTDLRVDSMAWKAIREGLESGPVLVQVAAKGTATSVFCAACDKRAECGSCNGPLWIDERNYVKCRWCNAVNVDYSCQACAGTKLKQGFAGTTRTIAEFGRAFAGVQLIEATGENRTQTLKTGKFLVVATPGAEPRVDGGYSAVVILDANRALNRDSLRSTEDAVRNWSNAIALGSPDARNVLVGVAGLLAKKFSLWSQAEIAQREFATRAELRFPPAIRLASIGTTKDLIQEVQDELAKQSNLEILGPMPHADRGVNSEWRILIKYEYSDGAKLAELLKAISLKLSAGQQRVTAKSGRAMRPIRIKMDDVEVI